MYPTNYMNPMNNQPMSPDYGYNRMQQVQQMQQAINPTVPNMFGQMNQMNNMNQQQQTPYISAIPVTCLDEAKAARISLDGTLSVFINIQDGEIYTKQLNMNGLAELKTYKLVNPQENKVEYITSDTFNGLDQRVQNIEQLLASIGGNNPVFQQARKMAEGKSPEQMKETVLNLAKTQGVDIQQIMGMLNQFGIKI